jgi:hypothetical protein
MTFTDRRGRLRGDVEIPGVDAEEDNEDYLPGVVPVIADDTEITRVDAEGTETQDTVPAPQVEIDDLNIHHTDPAPIEVAPTQEKPRTETPAMVALPVLNYSHSRNPPCAPSRMHGRTQAPREPPN